MAILARLAAALSLLSLASALPSPGLNARACNGPFEPTAIFQLQEANPGSTKSSNGVFDIEQTSNGNGGVKNRVYTLVEFGPTSSGSNTCELVWDLAQSLMITASGNENQVDVIQVSNPGNNPTWNSVVGSSLEGPLFGTVNANPGTDAVVNTATCINSGSNGLAFVFKFTQSEEQSGKSAQIKFNLGSGTSIFLQDDC